jgi:hypothetical protein
MAASDGVSHLISNSRTTPICFTLKERDKGERAREREREEREKGREGGRERERKRDSERARARESTSLCRSFPAEL